MLELVTPRSIGARLTALYMVIALSALALFAGIIYWRLSTNFTAEHQRFLQAKIAELQVDLEDAHGDSRALVTEIMHETAGSQLRQYQARVLAADGRTLGETPGMRHELPTNLFPLTASRSPPAQMPQMRVDNHVYALTTVQLDHSGDLHPTRLQFAVDVTRDESLQADFRLTLGWAFALLLPLLALAGRAIAAYGLAPLQRISSATRSVTPTDLVARLPQTPPWPRELQELVGVFNAMLGRIEEAFGRQSRFSADIAHELRTPLGHISGELEVCLRRPRDAADYRAAIESALEECGRLNGLIENLLFMARAEHAQQSVQPERFDAAMACEWVIRQHATTAASRHIDIELQGSATVAADPLLFRQALANVLSNALRHAPDHSTLYIQLTSQKDGTEIRVHNEGDGVEAQHLPHLFDRFYQVDAARRRGAGQGTGLGLAIVGTIMALHQGSVRIESVPGSGATAIMHFPRTDLILPLADGGGPPHAT